MFARPFWIALVLTIPVVIYAELFRYWPEHAAAWGERGQRVVYLLENQRPLAAFALADVIRPESREAIRKLNEANVRVARLS
jgi:Cu2+-exporting ATPase